MAIRLFSKALFFPWIMCAQRNSQFRFAESEEVVPYWIVTGTTWSCPVLVSVSTAIPGTHKYMGDGRTDGENDYFITPHGRQAEWMEFTARWGGTAEDGEAEGDKTKEKINKPPKKWIKFVMKEFFAKGLSGI